jgi:hypothetical protein
MLSYRGWLLLLLLVSLTLPASSADIGVFVRFKLLEPAGTDYYVQIGGYVHVEPWTLSAMAWPAGADHDAARRAPRARSPSGPTSGNMPLHGWLHRAGRAAELLNITAFRDGRGEPDAQGADRAARGWPLHAASDG